MKRISFLTLFFILLISSCEDVVEIDTPTDEPRLIVNALMRVDVDQPNFPAEVRVSLTSNFFEENPVTDVDNMVIIGETFDEDGVITQTGVIEYLEKEVGTGIYIPDPNQSDGISTGIVDFDILYTLIITRGERRYAAQTKYVPSVPIDNLEIGDNTLFDDEETELIVTFTDDPDRDNYYLFDFGFGEFLPTEDRFIKGQQFTFSYFYDQTFEPGTILKVSLLGSDLTFFNYMNVLVEQTEGQQGPFQTPVTTARGNVFDITGLDNIDIFDNVERPEVFPLGYFAIVQEHRDSIMVE